jgi:WD40 repeat protein
MSDSEEDELRQLRQSAHYAPVRAADHAAEFRAMGLPVSFGSERSHADDNDDNDVSVTKPVAAASSPARASNDDDDGDEDDDGGDEDDGDVGAVDVRVPATHSATLCVAHERKPVSALAMDRSGSRFLSGAHDYAVKFWNFAAMTSELKSFRSVTPADGYQVTSLDYSFNGQLFLVANTSAQVKLYDRDGFEQTTFARGDSYLFDMKKTAGHTTQVNEARFAFGGQPDAAFTVSNDGTLRRWRVATADKAHDACALAKDAKGKKVSLLCLAVGESLIATGAENGAVLLWSSKGPLARPQSVVQAHSAGDDAVTRCALSPCGKYLLTRSATDQQLALFDVRNTKQAVWRVGDLHASHPTTACGFAPPNTAVQPKKANETGNAAAAAAAVASSDGLLAYAAVGARHGSGEGGGVAVVECATGRTVARLSLAAGVGAVSALWHPAINQIVVGQSDGMVRVFYRPATSLAGVVPALGKRAARKQDGVVPMAPIHLPNAHEAFAEPMSRKRQFEKDRQDARKTKRPDVGSKAMLTALRDTSVTSRKLGAGGQEVMERLMETGELPTNRSFRAEDPRDALLKYADVQGPTLISHVYSKTQPVPVFDYTALKDDDDDDDDDDDGDDKNDEQKKKR